MILSDGAMFACLSKQLKKQESKGINVCPKLSLPLIGMRNRKSPNPMESIAESLKPKTVWQGHVLSKSLLALKAAALITTSLPTSSKINGVIKETNSTSLYFESGSRIKQLTPSGSLISEYKIYSTYCKVSLVSTIILNL